MSLADSVLIDLVFLLVLFFFKSFLLGSFGGVSGSLGFFLLIFLDDLFYRLTCLLSF